MALVFEQFAVHLNGRRLLCLDRTVAPGEILSVMGPSGAGKSALLFAITGLLRPPFRASGRVLLSGRDLTRLKPEARHVGLMVQDALLFPHMSVVGNVVFALPRQVARGAKARRAAALTHLERVGLADLAERDPDTLSGGQRSRVALARTLAARPQALLLDEPFSALDQALRAEIRAMVFTLAREDGLPVVLVSHDPADAEAAAGPVAHLENLS